jgi:ribosome-associated heat shock protein Hsp15
VAAPTRQRIDKWLWFARIVKTRQLAARLVETGHVRINRNRVIKPGHDVVAGDTLTLTLFSGVKVLEVIACAERRGPASVARSHYRELAMANLDGPASQKEDASAVGNC